MLNELLITVLSGMCLYYAVRITAEVFYDVFHPDSGYAEYVE